MKKAIAIILLLGLGAFAGMRYEATAIQQSCEDPHASTLINGVQYTCLTPAQADRIAHALSQRGA